MTAGNEGEALLAVLEKLCLELAPPEAAKPLSPGPIASAGDGAPPVGERLDPERESLVHELRSRLAGVAAAAEARAPGESAERAMRVALDGSEVIVRGELMRGEVAQLRQLLPSLVYLVVVPRVGQGEALELSRRCSELLDETGHR